MKNLLFLVFILAVSVSSDAQGIQGNFRYSDHGDIYQYQFKGDSSVVIIHKTDTVSATYSTDTSKGPMHIDLQFYDNDGKPTYRTPGIFEWVGKDKIRMRMSADMLKRPVGFLPKGNKETILLIKEK